MYIPPPSVGVFRIHTQKVFFIMNIHDLPPTIASTALTTSGITVADCANAIKARGLCTAVSITVLDAMPKGSKLISARGYRGTHPLTWTDRPTDRIVHTAILTPDHQVIDWTARQFWHDAAYPNITPQDTYIKDWEHITIIDPSR